MKKKSLTTNLIEGLNKEISSKDRYRASLHLLDWIGCAFIGSTAQVGKIFIDFSKDYAKRSVQMFKMLPKGWELISV